MNKIVWNTPEYPAFKELSELYVEWKDLLKYKNPSKEDKCPDSHRNRTGRNFTFQNYSAWKIWK